MCIHYSVAWWSALYDFAERSACALACAKGMQKRCHKYEGGVIQAWLRRQHDEIKTMLDTSGLQHGSAGAVLGFKI